MEAPFTRNFCEVSQNFRVSCCLEFSKSCQNWLIFATIMQFPKKASVFDKSNLCFNEEVPVDEKVSHCLNTCCCHCCNLLEPLKIFFCLIQLSEEFKWYASYLAFWSSICWPEYIFLLGSWSTLPERVPSNLFAFLTWYEETIGIALFTASMNVWVADKNQPLWRIEPLRSQSLCVWYIILQNWIQ